MDSPPTFPRPETSPGGTDGSHTHRTRPERLSTWPIDAVCLQTDPTGQTRWWGPTHSSRRAPLQAMCQGDIAPHSAPKHAPTLSVWSRNSRRCRTDDQGHPAHCGSHSGVRLHSGNLTGLQERLQHLGSRGSSLWTRSFCPSFVQGW